jgi:(p)ppGpp synthase/HD superfamily hydrolase
MASAHERAGRAYSERVDEALRFAVAAHHEEVRKGTRVPYVMHPFHVGLILDRHGFHEDVVVAGILHDVLEDPHYERASVQDRLAETVPALRQAPRDADGFKAAVVEYLRGVFGDAVVAYVSHVTEQKCDERGGKRPWRVRKQEQMAGLSTAPAEVCAVKAADCVHNLTALARDLRALGPDVMTRFNAPADAILDYHAQVLDLVAPRLGPDAPIVCEFQQALGRFRDQLV